MAVLTDLQQSIESLHDVQSNLDVTAYIVNDDIRRDIPGSREGLLEQLFVSDYDGAVEMALYVAPHIVTQLEHDPPKTRLHDGNLESFCIALEGVSHFVMVAWRARHNLAVSALELEIQAEVDKFVAAWFMLVEQRGTRATGPALAAALHARLFGAWHLSEDLRGEELDRYVTASRLAAGFCEVLTRKHARDFSPQRVMRDTRAYFRSGLADKVARPG